MKARSTNPDPRTTKSEVLSRSPEETQALGERLGERLSPGDVVGLIGELGGGKTTFIQGVAKGLGIDPHLVKSPTFILMREYPGKVPMIHVDGYRLENAASVDPAQAAGGGARWLDLDWIFSPKKVSLIEWADRCQDALPEDYLELRFEHRSANQRRISAVAHGPRSEKCLTLFAKKVSDTSSETHE